jgi:hypothetical protein
MRTKLEEQRHSLKIQQRALRKMQELFLTASCGKLGCRKECLFGPEMCGKLNHMRKEYLPYMNVSLELLGGGKDDKV